MNIKIVVCYLLLALSLIAAPFYTGHNIGGTGLNISSNLSVLFCIPWFIAAGLFLALKAKIIILPKGWLLFLPFILLIIVMSISKNDEPVLWLFRIGAILIGALFLLALFQYKLNQKHTDVVLYGLVFAMLIHGCLGVVQTKLPFFMPFWLEGMAFNVPASIFQQINVQASYMATSLVIVIYLVSRPYFKTSHLFIKIFLLISVAVSTYVIFASGSRIGLLGMMLGLFFITISRYKYLANHKKYILCILLIINANAWLQQGNIDETMSKTVKLAEGQYSTQRLAIYTVALELVAQKPYLGHGIGNFKQEWERQADNFKARHPNAEMPADYSLTHPHNEILYWLVEGGVVVVLSIVLIVIAIFLALYRCGFSRGGAYLAILLPISLHTQTEMPFYHSILHWFTWLFLIFLPLRHSITKFRIKLSTSAYYLIGLVLLLSSTVVSHFMYKTYNAQLSFYNFLYKTRDLIDLEPALNNLYLRNVAIEVDMRSLLYMGIDHDKKEYVGNFVKWAAKMEPKISLMIYHDLVKAYDYLNYKNIECDLLGRGKSIYPSNVTLNDSFQKCLTQSKPN